MVICIQDEAGFNLFVAIPLKNGDLGPHAQCIIVSSLGFVLYYRAVHCLKRQKRQAIYRYLECILISQCIELTVLSITLYAQAINSTYVDNTTLQHEYFTSGARVWVHSLRLNRAVTAEELNHSLVLATAVITRVAVMRKDGT